MVHSVIELPEIFRGFGICAKVGEVRRGGGILTRAAVAANGPLDAGRGPRTLPLDVLWISQPCAKNRKNNSFSGRYVLPHSLRRALFAPCYSPRVF